MEKLTKSDLALHLEAIEMNRKKRQAEIEDFNKRLRDPDCTFTFDEATEYGYWRVPGGVMRLLKFKSGYHPTCDRQDFLDEEVEMFARLSKIEPRELEKETTLSPEDAELLNSPGLR